MVPAVWRRLAAYRSYAASLCNVRQELMAVEALALWWQHPIGFEYHLWSDEIAQDGRGRP
jgi:hypothetical protein